MIMGEMKMADEADGPLHSAVSLSGLSISYPDILC